MEKRFLKSKALFMIIIIVCMIFTVSNMKEVSADVQMTCCEETSSDYCVYTTEDGCVGDTVADTSCELTTFCETGCCISEEGTCSKNVPKAKCENTEGYTWQEGADCDVSQCEKNCCVIADYQCSYTTEDYCEYLIEDMEHIEKDFRSVDSESACSDICRASEEGCCVGDDLCTYGTRGECLNPEIDITTGDGFYESTYCTDVQPYCDVCEPCATTQCIGEDVYCFDSCGNQEGIFPGVTGNEGDCDYLVGEWCGYNDDGDAVCQSTNCVGPEMFDGAYDINQDGVFQNSEQRNAHDSNIVNDNDRSHGETWCLYESPAGGFRDVPGSQHYRSYCYFGEQIVEPCADYREQVCLQFPYTSTMEYKEGDMGKKGEMHRVAKESDDITSASCIYNTGELINVNVTTVPTGGQFWTGVGYGESCAVAEMDCEMQYATDSWADNTFEVGEGVMCTSPQWTKLMSDYCSSKGDCGVDMNLLEVFTSDGFYMTKSEDYLRHKSYDTTVDVGFDTCVAEYPSDGVNTYTYRGNRSNEQDFIERVADVNRFEAEGVFCLHDCDSDHGGCEFIETVDEEFYQKYMNGGMTYYQQMVPVEDETEIVLSGGYPNISFEDDYGSGAYGVYGGLVGLSEYLEDQAAGSGFDQGWVGGIYGSIGSDALYGISIVASLAIFAAVKAGSDVTLKAADIASKVTGALGNAANVASAVAIVAAVVSIIMNFASLGQVQGISNPIQRLEASNDLAVSAGIGAGLSVISAVLLAIVASGTTLGPFGIIASIAAAITAAIIAIFSAGGTTHDIVVSSHCEAWQPPKTGENCEFCDVPASLGGLAIDNSNFDDPRVLRGYECTEYKCKSLGACEYISENAGSDRSKCVSAEINPVEPKVIEYMVDFSDNMNNQGCADTEGFQTSSSSCVNFVPGTGLVIDKKVDPFEYITIGLLTDQLSQCKVTQDYNISNYDEMSENFPDSYFSYDHNQTWVLTPDEEFNFYVRCQNHGGADMIQAFQIKIETDDGPDITPAVIEAYETSSGSDYIPAGWETTHVKFYTNEPVQLCKWDYNDVDISLMSGYVEDLVSCPAGAATTSDGFEMRAEATLDVVTGENNYYIRCQDCSGNNNTEGYPLTLYGTEPLLIDSIYPLGETFYTNDITMSVATSSGAEGGKAICYYNNIEFFDSNSTMHAQQLEDLNAGDFNYAIDCYDIAGNVNSSEISFSIDVDIDTPQLVSVYTDGVMVYYELDEIVSCEYYFEDFTFGSGTSVSSGSTEGSFAFATNIDTYYLTCQDVYGNEGSFIIGTDYFEG